MDTEVVVKLNFEGKIQLLPRNLPQCLFVLQKSHMTWFRTLVSVVGSQVALFQK
jgi:hypothetical protein